MQLSLLWYSSVQTGPNPRHVPDMYPVLIDNSAHIPQDH